MTRAPNRQRESLPPPFDPRCCAEPLLCSRALDSLGLKRYCCRRMLLTHVDLIDQLLQYNSESVTALGAFSGAV
jgi:hypothetical protein